MGAYHILFLAVLSSLLLLPCTEGLIHHLTIKSDTRNHFFIENFGFVRGGVLNLKVTDWKVNGQTPDPTAHPRDKAGFLIKITETDSTAFLEENTETPCLLDEADEGDEVIRGDQSANWTLTTKHIDIEEGQEGFYNTYFINCWGAPVSFVLDLEQYNVDVYGNKVYLSAGLAQLPSLYGVFAAAYVAMLVVWVFGFLRGPGKKVNRVHHLMALLVVLKFLSLLFQAVEMHYIKTNGIAGGWQVPYFIFAFLKTIFFFVLIALIGTGWTFVKPFLSEKDKKIIMFVVPLQVLDNIAMIIVDYTAPGSQGWFTWKDIFRLVDIICCGAVLIPIIWSIKHLREASQIDGKVARNLQKLKLFRQFYLIVVSYIYFTRIIIFLLDATLPFKLVWMGEMFSELAALSFFSIVGYKFRPAEDNPYFKMDVDDEDAIRLEEAAKESLED